jgi:hypothetical protein
VHCRAFRRFTAEQAGLGFHMPTVAPKLPIAPIAPNEARAQHALTAKDWSALADDFRTFLLGAENFEPVFAMA